MTARVWLVALAKTAVQTSWLWGSILLDRFGHHQAAMMLQAAAAGWFARLLWEHYLEFRVWRRKFIAWRRERRQDES